MTVTVCTWLLCTLTELPDKEAPLAMLKRYRNDSHYCYDSVLNEEGEEVGTGDVLRFLLETLGSGEHRAS